MADNIYKNSDDYKREIDKLTSTNNEILHFIQDSFIIIDLFRKFDL